jgi:ligand-binding sensor domain-containing protein/signal transduction histidine kinase/DNA-binding response OmpR family regulator
MNYKLFFHQIIIIQFLIISTLDTVGQLRNSFFNNYSISEGLSDNFIHCIFQDSKGWIWIGTSYGILRYDGYNFIKLQTNSPESESLGKTLVRTIYEDKSGVLWIGTENQGIYIYDRREYGIKQLKNQNKQISLNNNSIWAITGDTFDNLWIGSEDGLLKYNYNTGESKLVSYSKSARPVLSNNFIRSLHVDKEGYLWIGTNAGIEKLDIKSGKTKRYLKSNSLYERENEVWKIYEDALGQIWIGTYLGGLKKYIQPIDSFENFVLDPHNERARTVRAIVEDNYNNLWIGTRGGLYSINLNNSQINHYAHNQLEDNSLIHNSVLELFKDRKGDLWIGTRDGISYLNFDKQAFGYLSTGVGEGEYLNNNEVYAFWENENHDIWIGTENGGINLYHSKTGELTYVTKTNGLSSNCIKSMCPDGRGNLLIGTYLGGLNQLNLKTGEIIYYYHNLNDTASISGNAVWSIIRDRKNRIWVGTDGGFDLFDPVTGKFQRFGEKYGLKNIVMVYEDKKSRLWVYYENVKLSMIDSNGAIRDFPYKARTIWDDGTNIWLGTLGNGLIKLNLEQNQTEAFTVENGLCSNFIYGLVNIQGNNLWMSTKNGIARFDLKKGTFTNFSTTDGLLNDQYNYGAYILSKDGTLIFGGRKGVDFVFTNKLRENTFDPPIVLTDFKILNKSVPILNKSDKNALLTNFVSETQRIAMNYSRSALTFEFAALNYTNSSKNQYSYKLEGFDEFWNNVKNQRTATYTNLEPGEYTFIVKGSNNDGVFSSKVAKIAIAVLPPLYKTWYFRIIVLMVLFLLVYSLYILISNREKLKTQLFLERQSARKMQELERLKHQFFMNISHEIRTPLTLIIGPLEKVLNSNLDKRAILSHLEIVRRNTQNLTKLVNQLLDYRKLETGNIQLELKKGNFSDFFRDIVYSFKNMANEKKIKLSFRTTQNGIFTSFDPDKIEKIANNLLSNAIKFTGEGGSVSVNLSIIFLDDIEEDDSYVPEFDKSNINVKQFIQVVVRDTGIGIPSNQIDKIFNRFLQGTNTNKVNQGSGIGLNLTKELVKIHNGYIKVKSKEEKGSKFIVLIPFPEEDQIDNSSHEYHITEPNDEVASELFSSMAHESDLQNYIHSNIPIILLADDNSDLRIFIKHHFEPAYKVIEATNGQIAWEKSLEIIPDIIIADVMMPVLDGFELCRKIKKDERTSHIPLILLTALTSKEKQISGIDIGADDYITKPFDISLLKAKADNILSIRKALRERYSKELLLRPKDVVITSPDEKFFKRVITVIEKNMSNAEFDIDDFASHVGVSRTQLYRKIAAMTDMSAKEFIRDIRLKRAAQMILQDKLTISEIALEVGFNDINYFRKRFKKKFGMSATQFLKNNPQQSENSITF